MVFKYVIKKKNINIQFNIYIIFYRAHTFTYYVGKYVLKDQYMKNTRIKNIYMWAIRAYTFKSI